MGAIRISDMGASDSEVPVTLTYLYFIKVKKIIHKLLNVTGS